jgi:hypothetical protein
MYARWQTNHRFNHIISFNKVWFTSYCKSSNINVTRCKSRFSSTVKHLIMAAYGRNIDNLGLYIKYLVVRTDHIVYWILILSSNVRLGFQACRPIFTSSTIKMLQAVIISHIRNSWLSHLILLDLIILTEVVGWLTLLLRIRAVLGSDLDPQIVS